MDRTFYIVALDRSRDGEVMFWGPGGCGYTTSRAEAGLYELPEIEADPNRFNNGIDTIAIDERAFGYVVPSAIRLDALKTMAYGYKEPAGPEQVREVRLAPGDARLPEIYAFCNGGSPDWYSCDALSEDGEFLAGHVCSTPSWGLHDLGITSDWKHEHYRERYPGGYRVIWIEDVRNDPRISAAHAKHIAAGEEGTPWQRERKAREALGTSPGGGKAQEKG